MCGIFGFWLNRELNNHDIKLGKSGTQKLNYRGPDNLGFYKDDKKGLFLGHTRLSIIDLSIKANQPMQKHGLIITFNGEIYNYLEIKKVLKSKGYKFFTDSDTEVILSSVDCWGIKAIAKFDGMFSFALFKKDKLYLVTDLFLEKPLYVYSSKEGVYFSSEPQVLSKIFKIEKDEGIINNYNFISLGFLENGETGFKNLISLKPSTIREYKSSSKFIERKYWELPKFSYNSGLSMTENFIDEFMDLLLSSLKIRLRSDVPVGVLLSSGLDSTIVSTLIKKELKKDITAYTVSFDKKFDESIQASLIAKYLGIEHKVYKYTENFPSQEDLLLNIYGMPNDNTTAIAVKLISKIMKKNVKVVLSGIGGDELCLGYNKYKFISSNYYYFHLPQSIRKLLDFLKVLKIEKLDRALYYIDGSDSWRMTAIKNGESLASLKNKFVKLKNEIENENNNDFLINVKNFDLKQTLPFSYLPSIDRGSMREGLEVRTPFLCKALFEKVALLKQKELLDSNKVLFRKILRRYLPKELLNTQKVGFVVPNRPKKTIIKSSIVKKSMKNLFEKFENSKDYNSIRIYSRLQILNNFF